jgi:hypothetical protein
MNAARLNELLHYCPESGVFTWKVNRGRLAKAGSIAGTAQHGRVHIKADGRLHYAHRLAFLYMTGEFPSAEVDHIDGDPANNRWANLRPCTRDENLQNKKVSKSNKSGLLGVSRHRCGWQATIHADKKQIHLGLFQDPLEAHQAYLEAKAQLHGFNPNINPRRAEL